MHMPQAIWYVVADGVMGGFVLLLVVCVCVCVSACLCVHVQTHKTTNS